MTKRTNADVIAINMRLIRNHLGLSQEQAAKKAGTSVATWSKLEQANESVQFKALEKIAKTYKITVIDLLTDDYNALDSFKNTDNLLYMIKQERKETRRKPHHKQNLKYF